MDEAREIVYRWIRESPSTALKMICVPELVKPLIEAIDEYGRNERDRVLESYDER